MGQEDYGSQGQNVRQMESILTAVAFVAAVVAVDVGVAEEVLVDADSIVAGQVAFRTL